MSTSLLEPVSLTPAPLMADTSPATPTPASSEVRPTFFASQAGYQLAQSLLLAVALYTIWQVFYEQYIIHHPALLDGPMNRWVADQAVWVLNVMGYEAVTVHWREWPDLIVVGGKPTVNVGTPCNGIPMLYLFAGFVLVHPGPVGRKLWFAPLGLALIHGLNVIRVWLLALLYLHAPEAFHFNHKYVFAAVVYTLIIGMWAWWHLYLSEGQIGVTHGLSRFVTGRWDVAKARRLPPAERKD